MKRLVAALAFVLASGILPAIGANVFVSTVVIPMSTRSANTYSFTNVTVPTGVRGLELTMDVTEATDPLPALSAQLEGSIDGGNTWMGVGSAGSFSRNAGPRGTTPQGVPITTTGSSFLGGTFWNDTTNVNRRLRGSASIGGTMRFSLTVQPL